jgi:uncharacterized protein YggT (Ycf19 family)
MSLELLLKILTLLRVVAFMLIVYLAFGLLVERYSTRPESQLKAFARIVCSPITRPVSRFLPPGVSHSRLLLVGMGVVAIFWAVVVVLARAIRPA